MPGRCRLFCIPNRLTGSALLPQMPCSGLPGAGPSPAPDSLHAVERRLDFDATGTPVSHSIAHHYYAHSQQVETLSSASSSPAVSPKHIATAVDAQSTPSSVQQRSSRPIRFAAEQQRQPVQALQGLLDEQLAATPALGVSETPVLPAQRHWASSLAEKGAGDAQRACEEDAGVDPRVDDDAARSGLDQAQSSPLTPAAGSNAGNAGPAQDAAAADAVDGALRDEAAEDGMAEVDVLIGILEEMLGTSRQGAGQGAAGSAAAHVRAPPSTPAAGAAAAVPQSMDCAVGDDVVDDGE